MERKVQRVRLPDSNFQPVKTLEVSGNRGDGQELIGASILQTAAVGLLPQMRNKPRVWDHLFSPPGCQHPCLLS